MELIHTRICGESGSFGQGIAKPSENLFVVQATAAASIISSGEMFPELAPRSLGKSIPLDFSKLSLCRIPFHFFLNILGELHYSSA